MVKTVFPTLRRRLTVGKSSKAAEQRKTVRRPPEAWIDKPPQPDGWIEDTQHTDGQRGKIQYYGQEYQGTWKNGELYLDETSQYLFLVQTGVVGSIPSYLLYDKYKGLSVSQIVNEARLPLDPSKPLPKASSNVQEAIDCVELPPEVTEHAKYLYQTLPGGTDECTTHRFVDKANTAGPVTVTDVTVVEAPRRKSQIQRGLWPITSRRQRSRFLFLARATAWVWGV